MKVDSTLAVMATVITTLVLVFVCLWGYSTNFGDDYKISDNDPETDDDGVVEYKILSHQTTLLGTVFMISFIAKEPGACTVWNGSHQLLFAGHGKEMNYKSGYNQCTWAVTSPDLDPTEFTFYFEGEEGKLIE